MTSTGLWGPIVYGLPVRMPLIQRGNKMKNLGYLAAWVALIAGVLLIDHALGPDPEEMVAMSQQG